MYPALPVVILNSPAVSDPSRRGGNPAFGTGEDIAGIILFAIGLFWEAVGDIQKVCRERGGMLIVTSTCSSLHIHLKVNLAPKGCGTSPGKSYVAAALTRSHPPYFGEIVLHWGLWLLCRELQTRATH